MCMNGMGNVNAAAATEQAIETWDPAQILLCGIAGGIREKNERMLGDVLVAEQVVDYESGKQRVSGAEHRYEVFRPARALLDAARGLDAAQWALAIKQPRPDGTTRRVIPQVHFGVIGSGEKVITDPKVSEELSSHWAKLIGLEMEGVGTALAAWRAATPPGFLIVKGISDWADPEKDDSWRGYAAEASAVFALALLRAEPFEPRSRPSAAHVSGSPPTLVEPVEPPSRPPTVHTGGPPPKYSGEVKREVCQRLDVDWKDLADHFGVEVRDRRRFEPGREPEGLWEWLERRGRLGELSEGFARINRGDLIPLLKPESEVLPPPF
jgi:nucleoside phosphorylase